MIIYICLVPQEKNPLGDLEREKHKVFICGGHEAMPDRSNKLCFMKEPVSEYSPPNERYNMKTERYIVGLIFHRIVCEVPTDQELPKGSEQGELKRANLKQCRNNILRVLALQLLSKDPDDRPTHRFCLAWPSNWDDERYFHFLVRFFDRISINSGSAILRPKAKRMLNKFELEVVGPGSWFDEDKLTTTAYITILDEVRQGDASRWKVRPGDDDAGNKEVESYIRKDGLYGLFWQFRNRSSHFFEFLQMSRVSGHLSCDFVNWWRGTFPLMFTCAFLVAINLNLHLDGSFREFFNAKDKFFFENFKNMNCHGRYLRLNV